MTQRNLFPFLLVGLPVGLAVSVVVGLYLYYHPLDIPLPSRPSRPDAVTLLRRSPTAQDLRDYQRILTTDLASRPLLNPAAQRAAANWISSTLGPSNLGLPVRRVDSEMPGTQPGLISPTLLVELPGTRQKNEVLVVVTGYGTDTPGLNSSLSTSTLMTVAGAFAGTPQRRTLVFAFLGTEAPAVQGAPPIDTLVQSLRLRDFKVQGILDLRVAAPAPAAETNRPGARARLDALAPREGQSWTGPVREAMATRKPDGLTVEFLSAPDAPPAAAALAGWSAAPAPYILLWLSPSAPNDETSPLAVARSLEAVLQTLANQ